MKDITLNKVEVSRMQATGPATPRNLITTGNLPINNVLYSSSSSCPINTLGWQESLVELSRGLDFSSQTPVRVYDDLVLLK